MDVSIKLGRIIFVVAEFDQAEIINADSIQFYSQIEVGTAKPGPELTSRAHHHLLSFVDPPKTLSAGDFTRAAEKVLVERTVAGVKNFVIVGGSGFYLQALEKGMIPAPIISEKIREQVKLKFENEGSEKLWTEVEKRDPEYALKVSKQDSYRVQRALEILLSGLTSISQAQRDFASQESSFRKKYRIQKIARQSLGRRSRAFKSTRFYRLVSFKKRWIFRNW
mgnify:CR=1 FL=1